MEPPERPSKSQRKRDMAALQDLGAELVALSAEQLAQIELPERLAEAVIAAQRIRDFEGRRRQLQFIGKLMREIDPAPVRAALERWRSIDRAHASLQHDAERWRERLLGEDGALASFAAAYPRCDLQRLRSLVASVRRDRAAARTPRNYRELFRAIRDAVAATAGSADTHLTE